MNNLPDLPVREIRVVRKGSLTELRQFVFEDAQFFKERSGTWVRETTTLGLDEILAAENPKFYSVEVNGTTGANSNQRRGFTPGNISQARNSARVVFLGKELADLANQLRPLLSTVIRTTFPRSKLQRLARDWVWWVQREGLGKKRTPTEYIGGRVSPDIGIYDVLWLVPESPEPASYAWFANYRARRKVTSYNFIKKRSGHIKPRARKVGYLGEAVKRMRSKKFPGVNIIATFIDSGMGAERSRRLEKGRLPAIRVSFVPGLIRSVSTN